jgi:hypothetical protein
VSEKRYYTAREIDGLIPRLEQIFEHIEGCKTRAEELAAQVLCPTDSNVPADVARIQLLRSQVEFLMEAIQDDIRTIETLGGITKDVELGLVDFLGDVAGQDVWLCWRRGETKIRFWHPLDSGYNQRRPLPQPAKRSRMH